MDFFEFIKNMAILDPWISFALVIGAELGFIHACSEIAGQGGLLVVGHTRTR